MCQHFGVFSLSLTDVHFSWEQVLYLCHDESEFGDDDDDGGLL